MNAPRFRYRSMYSCAPVLAVPVFLLVLRLAAQAQPAAAGAPEGARLRLLIETDAGGDPDDEQSLVRFLLYTNEWDVEGIIANRLGARDGENLNVERTGLGIVRRLVEAYAECWPSLVRHDPRYPDPQVLRRRTVAGHDGTGEGVEMIIAAVDRDDPRPLWYSDWGSDPGSGINNLQRALDRVRRDRGQEGYARFKKRLRLSSQDTFGDHVGLDPPFPLWVDTFRPEKERRRWYHRFSAITATAGGFDLERDVRTGHGPLGALYPTNTTHRQKEGDTMTFLYLVPTGMNDPEEPSWGSWAGRYGLQDDHPGKPYYWASAEDTWEGSTHRENTLRRWAVDIQNDFRARLDACVRPPAEVNHPPRVLVEGPRRRTAASGQRIELDARRTSDPDGDALSFRWEVYREAGSLEGPVALDGAASPLSSFTAPAVPSPRTIHLLLTVTDGGKPALSRHGRVVVTVEPAAVTAAAPVERSSPGAPGPGLAARYPGDAGIEKDPAVLFAEGFEAESLEDVVKRWTEAGNPGGGALALDSDVLPGSPGRRSLRMTADVRKDTGGNLYRLLPREVEKLHARFYVKFAPENDYTHHFVTVGGYHPATRWPQGSAGERPRGDDRITVGIEPFGENGRHPAPGVWAFYTYWHEMKISADGRHWGNGLRPARPQIIPRATWQCVEVMVQLNSTPELADGELMLWLDGALAAHFAKGKPRGGWTGMGFTLAEEGGEPFEGLRWRTQKDLKLNFFWLLHYVTDRTARKNPVNRVWFDHIVVAESYVGPIVPSK